MTRTLDLPSDPAAANEVAALLREHVADDEQLAALAWQWAQQAADTDDAAAATYWRVLDAAGVAPETTTEHAQRQPAPQPTADPEPQAAPESEPTSATSSPSMSMSMSMSRDLTARLAALTQRVESEPTTTASPVPKWDPDETPIIAGQVATIEYADLRQRSGPIRIVTLRTPAGPTEVWASWQQLAALLRAAELAQGRALRSGELLAIQARGRQRVGRSRSPSRLFALQIEWADQP